MRPEVVPALLLHVGDLAAELDVVVVLADGEGEVDLDKFPAVDGHTPDRGAEHQQLPLLESAEVRVVDAPHAVEDLVAELLAE